VTWIVTEKASIDDTTDAASYTVPSFTPAANRFYALVVFNVRSAGAASTPTGTFNGTGLSWTSIGSTNTGHTSFRITAFRAQAGSVTAGTTTIDFGGVTQGCCYAKGFEIYEDTNPVISTGTQGSGALGSNIATTGASSTSRTVTMSAFDDATNSLTMAFYLGQSGATGPCTPEGSFTELFDQNNIGGGGYDLSHHVYGQWLPTPDTTPANTATNAADYGVIAFEVKRASGGGGFRNFYGSKFYGTQYAPVSPMERRGAIARYHREREVEMRRFMASVERRAA
jgi:hypothetical protein